RLDILQRQGHYPPPPGASATLGVEVSGEIVEIADDCKNLARGDKVCALLSGGGYAEYVLADAATCLPVPAGISMTEAAALPEACFTVWSNIFHPARLLPGSTFLVHGGSSGIGTTAIQMARAFSVTVFTTAGTDEKCRFCTSLGADVVINYRSQDFVKECLSATDQHGINVILDMVGGEYLNRNITAAAEDGKIIMISALNGYRTGIDLLAVMRKRLIITGSTLRSRSLKFKQKIAGELLREVWPILETKQIKPVIYHTYPLSQATAAHQLMESGDHIGKIVLTVD
ncbi:MAG: NAD(P)H-quinone oxidoreductase, partial [Gammaproteobacteria bacterium]